MSSGQSRSYSEPEASPAPPRGPDGSGPGPSPVRTSAEAAPASGFKRARWWLLGIALAIVALAVFRLSGNDASTQTATRPPVAVRAVAVTRGDLSIRSSYSGELVGEVSDIAPQVGGLLRDVPVRVGDTVREGDVLAAIDDVDLRHQHLEAQGQLRVAEANLEKTRAELQGIAADYGRSLELHNQRLISDQEIERISAQRATAQASVAAAKAQVEQARAREAILEEQYRQTRVLAPFDGTVADRYLDRGALVQPGTPILRLVEAAPLLVQFRVPERDLASVTPGAELTVSTQVTEGRSFVGRVQRVSGEVSRKDRTALVEAELTRTNELLRPGMYAEISVRLRGIDGALLVPGASILERVSMDGETRLGVFVAEDDHAVWAPVEVLGRSGDVAAVSSDVLGEGAFVLTMGHTELEPGAAIRVVSVRPEPGTLFPISNPS